MGCPGGWCEVTSSFGAGVSPVCPGAGRPGGWCEGEFAVGVAGDLFVVFVDAGVVAAPADQAGVVECGLTAVGPVFDVVDLADAVVGAAADAAAVAGDQLFVEPFGNLALGAAQQRGVGVFVEMPGRIRASHAAARVSASVRRVSSGRRPLLISPLTTS